MVASCLWDAEGGRKWWHQAALYWAGLSPAQTQKMLVQEAVPGLALIILPPSPSCSLLCAPLVGGTQKGMS